MDAATSAALKACLGSKIKHHL